MKTKTTLFVGKW